jgi:glycosyltransferase involved in cell wall biosynthesis
VIGGPILVYHRIKNLSLMGHKITLIAPAYTEQDLSDRSLEPFCEKIIRVDLSKPRSNDEVEAFHQRLDRPRFFLSGDGGFSQEIEDALNMMVKKRRIDAVIAEYSMMGQYIEANHGFFPAHTTGVISVHECYTKAHKLRAQKGEKISPALIEELHDYELRMYRAADRLLTLTGEDADILAAYWPELKGKIRVVPHGVDTEFYMPPEDERGDRNSKNILYLGNFQHNPNVDAVKNFVGKCWERILKRIPDAKFFAIGFKPPQVLLELAAEFKNVIVREGGDDQNVRRMYWESDVFVAPIELGTGFRGKLLEAMACGLPVVATQLATFGISPTNEENMLVADDYDVFSDYVIALLEDNVLRKKISENGLLLAKQFDHKNAAEKLARVLEEDKSGQ